MKTTRAKTGLVLQGYFRGERFRGMANRAAVAQPNGSPRPTPQPPRPELLPASMRGRAGQARPECGSGGAWHGAPRPELLPGMGPSSVGGPRRVGQARSSTGISTTSIPAGQLRVIGEGRPLEPGIRQTMERFFEADFSRVRVHEGPAAHAVGALAFTLGEDLHFAPGLYDPASREGVELLGHELTHVVQQRDGRVANPYGQGVAIVQDPALEAEADRMGQRIADEMWPGSRVGQPAVQARVGNQPAFLAWRPGSLAIGPSAFGHPPRPAVAMRAAVTGSMPRRASLPGTQAVLCSTEGWTPVVDKKKLKKRETHFIEKQEWKMKIPRTSCIGVAGSISVEVASADMGSSAYAVLQEWLPTFYNHLSKTDNESNRTSFVCAEVNAVVQLVNKTLLAKKVPNIDSIRISHSWDAQTSKWKGPCRNCRTWLTSTGNTMDWVVGEKTYKVAEYKIDL